MNLGELSLGELRMLEELLFRYARNNCPHCVAQRPPYRNGWLNQWEHNLDGVGVIPCQSQAAWEAHSQVSAKIRTL